MQFGSDNQTGCSPQVLQALIEANVGHSHGYGQDDWTARAVAALRDVFETDLQAYFVATGTAANGLALASLVQPWQLVLCHAQSHIATDESTAPEGFTGGARVQAIARDDPKLTAQALREHLARAGRDHPHNPQAGAVSIAQATECGLVYSPDEITALAECARGERDGPSHGWRALCECPGCARLQPRAVELARWRRHPHAGRLEERLLGGRGDPGLSQGPGGGARAPA